MKNGKNPTPKKNISNIFKEFTYLVGETFRKLSAESDPMRDAIKNGEVDKVESLLSKGANPDNIERSWCTPLVLSITYKQYGCALLLLQNGADPNKKYTDGNKKQSPLQLCFNHNNTSFIRLLILFGAAISGIVYDNDSQASVRDIAIDADKIFQKIRNLFHSIQKAESTQNWKLMHEKYKNLSEIYTKLSKSEIVEVLKEYYELVASKYRNDAIKCEEEIYANTNYLNEKNSSYLSFFQENNNNSNNLSQPLLPAETETISENSSYSKFKIA